MAKGNTKQRAKKKQQKQQQRKKKLARRDGRSAAPQGFTSRDKPIDVLKGWDPVKHGITGLAHRRHLSFVDAAHYADIAWRASQAAIKDYWSLARIAACSDEQIVERLASLRIATDRGSYLAATANDVSALPHAAEPWARALSKDSHVSDVDFVQLAALDLWRRWRPERPSREMLLLRHHAGWEADASGRPGEAIEAWLDFGEMIWKAFPDARRMEDIDKVLNDPSVKHSIFYFDAFVEVFAGVASEQALVDDDGKTSALRVADYLRAVIDRLPDSKREHIEMIEGSRADLLDACGRRDEALAVLRGMIDKAPNRAVGYAMLSEALVDSETPAKADIDEAIAVLRRGLALAEDAKDWELERRIEDLTHELGHLER